MKPMLAREFEGQQIDGWLASEKLDGVRAMWDGMRFVSRNGKVFNAPAAFRAGMPSTPLDGELWMGRGKFQSTVSAIKKTCGDWAGVTFVAFDAPMTHGTFSERIKAVHAAVDGFASCKALSHHPIQDEDAMWEMFGDLTADGAEGLILRNPAASYSSSRSRDMLKVKGICTDEARVISINKSTATCEWCGMEIKIRAVADHVQIGDEITFAFCGLTDGGIPRHANFVEVRNYE